MKALCCLVLALTIPIRAEEASDRIEITRVVTALNGSSARLDWFTPDADGISLLTQLAARANLTVIISHEPWGEATIGPLWTPDPPRPRITVSQIRFLTSDVSLVDASSTPLSGAEPVPLLIVFKKDADTWKIVSLRVLQPPSPTH